MNDPDEAKYVSSHAPVRGQRFRPHIYGLRHNVSSHAPVRGQHKILLDNDPDYLFQVMPP